MTGPPWCRRRCGAPSHKSQHAPLPWESGVVYGSLHCWRCPPAAQERGRPMHGDSSLTVSGPPNARSPPSAADVRAQLDILLASPDFDVPARARRFLSYVVEETLAGRADRIKAYSVGMEVFGRDQNFDAQNDPAVRIEAGRIRRALTHYYLAAGLSDPIIIDIPKGAYVPHFAWRTEQVTDRPAGARPPTDVPVAKSSIWSKRQVVSLGAGLALLAATL